MPLPTSTPAWVLDRQNGIESLGFLEHVPLPPLKEDEILVRIHAASINYRDVMIAKVPYLSLLAYAMIFVFLNDALTRH